MARLHVLGAGSQAATLARQTTSYLIETRRSIILVGAGGGVSRLEDPWFRDLKERVPRALVILPSLRHDFVSGLPELKTWLAGMEVLIAAPSPAAEATLRHWLSEAFLGESLDQWLAHFAEGSRLQALRPGRQRLLGEAVDALLTNESEALVRVREAAFALGAAADPALKDFARRAAVLVTGGHPGDAAAAVRAFATLSREAEVQDLLIAHHRPDLETGALESLLFAAATIFPRTTLASDMALVGTLEVEAEEDAGAPGTSEDGAADEESANPLAGEAEGQDAAER